MKFQVLMLCTKPRFGVMIQMNLLRYSFRIFVLFLQHVNLGLKD